MKDFKRLVQTGDFKEAYKIAEKMKRKEICEDLVEISFDTRNMLAYGFVVYALLKNETPKYHWIASYLLGNSYIDIEGAAELGLCHAKRILEIEENSLEGLACFMGWVKHPDTSGTEADYNWAKQRVNELYKDDSILNAGFNSGLSKEDFLNSKLSNTLDD